MEEMKVRLTFTEDVLGTQAMDAEIHETFITNKGLEEAKAQLKKYKDKGGMSDDELNRLEQIIDELEATTDEKKREELEAIASDNNDNDNEKPVQGKTVFPKLEDGTPFLWDYQIRGFFKSAASAMSYVGGDHKLQAYKKKIDLLVFINDRKIPLVMPEGGEIGNCQRPLRGQTAQGERIALADSESVPAGTTCEFTIRMLDKKLKKHVIDWLDFGQYNGIGQWRNSGKGRYTWTDISDS